MGMLKFITLFIQFNAAFAVDGEYEERFYNQTLDHFNPQIHSRFQHRYLFSDEFFDGSGELSNGCKGPILFYTGNEGDIKGTTKAPLSLRFRKGGPVRD